MDCPSYQECFPAEKILVKPLGTTVIASSRRKSPMSPRSLMPLVSKSSLGKFFPLRQVMFYTCCSMTEDWYMRHVMFYIDVPTVFHDWGLMTNRTKSSVTRSWENLHNRIHQCILKLWPQTISLSWIYRHLSLSNKQCF